MSPTPAQPLDRLSPPCAAISGMRSTQLLMEAAQLRLSSMVNLLVSLVAVGYVGVSIVLLILLHDVMQCDRGSCAIDVMPKRSFHLLEFWAAFVFNVANVFALTYAPKDGGGMQGNPTILKLVVFVNIAVSAISSTLIAINTEVFEKLSHELEYSNELTMALIDILMFLSVLQAFWRGDEVRGGQVRRRVLALSAAAVGAALCVAVLQLVIYNGAGFDEGGDARAEEEAHYFEFSFGVVTASVTFWFTMGNKLSADARLDELCGFGSACPADGHGGEGPGQVLLAETGSHGSQALV